LRKRRIERRRYWINKYKVARGCDICGYQKKAVALHFDHIDSSKKKRAVAHMIDVSIKNLIAEVRKCRLLCANCHYIETDKER